MKEIDLGVDSKRREQGNENQHVKKLIPSPRDIFGSFLLEK
jgi:hypothetical protein